MTLEKITQELNENFKDQKGILLDFNIYLTPSSEKYSKTEQLTKTFKEVHKEYYKKFKLNFRYNFQTIEKPLTTPEVLANAFSKDEPIVDHTGKELNADQITEIGMWYAAIHPLEKKLSDYQTAIGNRPDKKEKELNCILTGTPTSFYGTGGLCYQYGAAPLGGQNFIATINRKKEKISKTIIHEIGHCFGADHSPIPLSIMKTPTFMSLKWWDPWSKKTVKKGIQKLF